MCKQQSVQIPAGFVKGNVQWLSFLKHTDVSILETELAR